jgi:pimeloyl-ACP methyl ester carboxylesterase
MIKQSHATSPFRFQVGVQQPFSFVWACGTQIAISRVGKGSPVICLHATGHGGRDYAAFANSISSDGFEVICVDWPGQGASPEDALARTASAEFYADLLVELVPKLCGDKHPILLGNSIGGAAALSYALRFPDSARGLVLCNPGGLAPLNGLAKAVIAAMVAFFAAGERGARWFPTAFSTYYKLVLSGKPASDQRARIVAAGLETAHILKQAWDSFSHAETDLRHRALGAQIPTLFAWAKHDKIVAWSRSRKCVESLPTAEVKMFKGGHSAFLEDPVAFRAEFIAFVKRIAP